MMASDREKLQLIHDTRNGTHPVYTKSLLPPPPSSVAALSVTEKMEFTYNPNGTLNNLAIKGASPITYTFVWNNDNTLSRIIKRETV